MDLPALPPCPVGKKGAHSIAAVIPGDDEHDVTFYCEQCCTLRRVPASGAIVVERLDDLESDEILRLTRRR